VGGACMGQGYFLRSTLSPHHSLALEIVRFFIRWETQAIHGKIAMIVTAQAWASGIV
jgi:hypothetical protein